MKQLITDIVELTPMTKLKMSGMKAPGDDFANGSCWVSVSFIGILRSVGDNVRAVSTKAPH